MKKVSKGVVMTDEDGCPPWCGLCAY